jgi:hypothetical protein
MEKNENQAQLISTITVPAISTLDLGYHDGTRKKDGYQSYPPFDTTTQQSTTASVSSASHQQGRAAVAEKENTESGGSTAGSTQNDKPADERRPTTPSVTTNRRPNPQASDDAEIPLVQGVIPLDSKVGNEHAKVTLAQQPQEHRLGNTTNRLRPSGQHDKGLLSMLFNVFT